MQAIIIFSVAMHVKSYLYYKQKYLLIDILFLGTNDVDKLIFALVDIYHYREIRRLEQAVSVFLPFYACM